MINTYRTKLIEKLQLTNKVYLFRFSLIESATIDFFAGQYIILSIPQEGSVIKRLYSIASSPSVKDGFELIVEVIDGGAGSNYLKNLNINDEVNFQGPAGVFTLKENDKNKIFLATGTGIAPVRSMIKKLESTNNKLQIYLYWGLQYIKDVYLLEELKNYISRNTSFKFKICLSREEGLETISPADKNFFTLGHVDAICPIIGNADYYLCGAPKIVESLRECLRQKRIPNENIFSEKF